MSLPLVAEQININGKQMIRVKHGPYLVGYFYTAEQVEERIKNLGHSMADLEIMTAVTAAS